MKFLYPVFILLFSLLNRRNLFWYEGAIFPFFPFKQVNPNNLSSYKPLSFSKQNRLSERA
ncbi:hypothetical protein BEH_05610 [Priestia filamentosa]|uniref:Uncharacterized protein n=1 Tax=Priestia filamentosa TaxID=1402861 RepID=A0A0H4KH35_9BACI|nr:hypothetical protein BEH_05610 [Priestia filamentosa]OXS67831.1 hypothetical protein B1B01_14740 [Priestia filamentosa]